MTTERNLITEADIYLAASGSAASPEARALALASCRLCVDAAKEATRQIEILLGAREREAKRVAKLGGAP